MAGTDILKFHGLQTVVADTGPRTITVPSSSIIGLVDTFTPGADFAQPDKPIKITNRREAAAAFGEGSAIYASCIEIFTRTSAAVAAASSVWPLAQASRKATPARDRGRHTTSACGRVSKAPSPVHSSASW